MTRPSASAAAKAASPSVSRRGERSLEHEPVPRAPENFAQMSASDGRRARRQRRDRALQTRRLLRRESLDQHHYGYPGDETHAYRVSPSACQVERLTQRGRCGQRIHVDKQTGAANLQLRQSAVKPCRAQPGHRFIQLTPQLLPLALTPMRANGKQALVEEGVANNQPGINCTTQRQHLGNEIARASDAASGIDHRS